MSNPYAPNLETWLGRCRGIVDQYMMELGLDRGYEDTLRLGLTADDEQRAMYTTGVDPTEWAMELIDRLVAASSCTGCGELDSTVRDYVVAPPVSGYTADVEPWHETCAATAARALAE